MDQAHLLVSPLHGTVSLEEVDAVALRVGKELDLDVAGFVKEAWMSTGEAGLLASTDAR